MLDFTKEELSMLVEDGYKPGYMMDIQEGDLIAIPPVMRTQVGDNSAHLVKTLVVQRLMHFRGDYTNEDGQLVEHTVIVFIGIDLDGLPEHCSYGNTYPCFIKREAE